MVLLGIGVFGGQGLEGPASLNEGGGLCGRLEM
jgi:hypothetical protein